jgi:uncharacterized protein (DUF1800 family)
MRRSRRGARIVLGLIALLPLLAASTRIPKKIKTRDNPPQYLAFSRPLSQELRFRHALERLTFGPESGDLERIRRIGLEKWIQLQLHPERVPEDALLMQRLAPLESLQTSIHDTYVHYPSPQMIAAVARGRGQLPDDPELRAIVARLADRYLKKREAGLDKVVNSSTPGILLNGNDDSNLDLKVKLSALLTPQQIETLRNANPEEKRELLAAIPAEKRSDFVWALRPTERRQLLAFAPVELRRELMLSVNPQNVVATDLSEGKLLRAIYSNHQLAELLDDFWYNHFNVFLNKGGDRFMVPTYEREAIRPYLFGKFHDLLLATAQSPAMLFYLDNWESVGTDAGGDHTFRLGQQKNRHGLNENYGRELLELHTLGVDGGYTQRDVIEVARCFTGWTIAGPRRGGGFEYNDRMHDKRQKLVLGHVIPAGGGMDDGLKVLDILAHHPSTAHFISLKLAQRFVADNPPPSLVNRMAKTFMKTDGDLREVMRTMLISPEFWSEGAYRAKVKMPFEMVVSAIRATNADITSAFLLGDELQKLGEPLYRKIEPSGYSSLNAPWVSSAGLLDRMNFGLTLAQNKVAGINVRVGESDPVEVARCILGGDPSPSTKAAIEKAVNDPDLQVHLAGQVKASAPQLPNLIAGLVIGSPEFQRH